MAVRPHQIWLLLLLASGARPVVAQVGTTTDIITGTVTGPDRLPLAGATVQAISLETQVSRQRTTDAHGRFTIVFPDVSARGSPRSISSSTGDPTGSDWTAGSPCRWSR